jgi:predicted neuraminidase
LDGAWSKPVEVATGSEGEDRDYPCWNPVLFRPGKSPVMLFYKVGPSPSSWWGVLMTSDDDGRTWSKPRRLGENAAIGHLIGPVKNKPALLPDGAILCGSSTEHKGWRVHFELTRDLGKTWEVIGPIHDGKTFGAIQPTILTHPGGRSQVLCRTQQDVLSQAWSDDGGRTWGEMTAAPLPNPSAGVDAVTLKDGRHLLVYNHTTGKTGGRNMLNVAISADGKAWTPVLTLENEPRKAGYAYPAVIQTPDGKVHTTYTWGRVSIKHVVLDPEQIQ